MIPVNQVVIAKNAKKYVLDCITSGWVSSQGRYINKFETQFAKFVGTRYALTTNTGTSALQLAQAAMGIGPGDEVIMPDLTIISCPLSTIYLGARPVFVDIVETTGNIDVNKIEEKISAKTRAIMVVHLYGHPANMEAIMRLAKIHKLLVIEDAAEAHGAQVKVQSWAKAGSIGDVGCFSFYANKLITTGEGGMVVTNNKNLYLKMQSLKDLAHSKKRRFLHYEVGYNFRMTNLQAALGLAQLEEVDKSISKKRFVARVYSKKLKDLDYLELPAEEPYAKSVYWMYAVRVKKNSRLRRDDIRKKLAKMGIETRDFFVPMHRQPVLAKLGIADGRYPVADDLSSRGFYLPSGLGITKNQIEQVADGLHNLTHL